MKYIELGEVFKINIDNKMIYLKVEPDNSEYLCEECYFELNGGCIEGKAICHMIDRKDSINVIYKQVNPIQDIFVVFGIKIDGDTKQYGAYPNEKDAKKKVEELNKHNINFAHFYEKIQYYPYGIINDIKEVKSINNFSTGK